MKLAGTVMRSPADCETLPQIVIVDDVLSRRECEELIARIAEGEWHPTASLNEDQPLITSGADASDAGRDQHGLAFRDDALLALRLYQRVAEHLPTRIADRELFGLKPSLHFLRYRPGHGSSLHEDRPYLGSREEQSALTLLVYLNDGFEAGETDFPEQGRTVAPRTGRAVIFPHGTLHRGCTVGAGTKYVLRTEVYYSPEPLTGQRAG